MACTCYVQARICPLIHSEPLYYTLFSQLVKGKVLILLDFSMLWGFFDVLWEGLEIGARYCVGALSKYADGVYVGATIGRQQIGNAPYAAAE